MCDPSDHIKSNLMLGGVTPRNRIEEKKMGVNFAFLYVLLTNDKKKTHIDKNYYQW